jgi:light-regulated signal transduction histidine kinase (bacteriophytochrome)
LRGEAREISGSYTPDLDEHGRVRGFVVLGLDVTERKRAEAALREHAEALSRSNADLQQFGYAISHDLQEPLRTIGGFTQLLAKRYRGRLNGEADELIEYITGGVDRMSRLITDLLAYSQLSRSGEHMDSAVDMSAVVSAAVENLAQSIADTGARVTWEELPAVCGDYTRLVQLMQNLIGNSIKYRQPASAPEVHIAAKVEQDQWRFVVTDNGVGFPQEQAERIFGLFKRLHGFSVPGTGIGLAICRRIVEQHGGRIWTEGRPGSGATFYFTLRPASPSCQQQDEPGVAAMAEQA